MANITNLEIEQIRLHLVTGGFLGPFTDIFGNEQPAPETQMSELSTESLNNNQRVVMIRNTGGISNPTTSIFHTQRNMIIVVVSQAGGNDSIIANGLAVDIQRYLLENPFDKSCLANISSSGVNGPFIMPDGRRAYEINFLAMFNIGEVTLYQGATELDE